jgi:hypothetical protein
VQLVKEKKPGRLHSLSERICWGATRLATLGLKISPSAQQPFRQALKSSRPD